MLFRSRGETKEFRPQTSFAGTATAVPAVPDARLNFYPGTKLQDNVKTVMSLASGAIVGTHFKVDGNTWNAVDRDRVKLFMDVVAGLR